MSTIWIKICGITQTADARAVAAMGVDAIGLNFSSSSPRAITVSAVKLILPGLPAGLQVFGLFVDQSRAEVDTALANRRIDHLQFHGAESDDFCASFGLPFMKAIRVRDVDSALREIDSYPSASSILLDSYDRNVPGGTGKTFDWSIARTIVKQSRRRIVLAGGLNAANVGAAIDEVQPFGVDVSSGVEESVGMKDLSKVRAFVEGVRSVGN